jgi:UDP-glucose 4-epimerase
VKILVTGAAGFIGSCVVKALSTKPHYEIIAVDNNFRYGFELLEKFKLPNVHLIAIDICNQQEISKLFKEDLDVVVHLSALPGKRFTDEHPEVAIRSNIFGTYRLIEESLKTKLQLFIFSSTYEVYGHPQYLPIDEIHPIQPLNLYSFTKVACENLIEMNKTKDTPFTILRFAPVYGYGVFTRWNEVISKFVQLTFNEHDITIFKPPNLSQAGEQIIDPIHVQDIATCISTLIEHTDSIQGKTYNLSYGKGISIRELAEIVIELAKERLNKEIRLNEQPSHENEIPKIVLSNEKIYRDIGWKPEITPREGINDLFSHYLKNDRIPR